MKFVLKAFQKLAKNFRFDISNQKCILLTKMSETTQYKTTVSIRSISEPKEL